MTVVHRIRPKTSSSDLHDATKKRLSVRRPAVPWLVTLAAVVVGAIGFLSTRDDGGNGGTGPNEITGPAGATGADTGHPRVVAPATLAGERVEEVYEAIRDQLRMRYARSDDPVTLAYSQWRRYNQVPYRSSRHGDHFVNNYANDAAGGYGRFENASPMPEGAIIAKDSFVVTRNGDVLAGPLFLMEKMASGFNAATGDWRYMMIDEHGEIVGMTGGVNSRNMRFCNGCHAEAGQGRDRLFFVPKAVRIPLE